MKVFLDDERMPSQVYGDGADDEWVIVRHPDEVKRLLKNEHVSHLSLDNDLGDGIPEGHTVVRWMIENNIWPTDECWVHSQNWIRRPNMIADIKRYFYNLGA